MGAASEFVLRMQDQVSGNASLAEGALGRLEAKINSEKEALGALNDKAILAGQGLARLQEGFGGKVDIAAVQKAKDSIAALQAKIGEKKEGIGILEGAKPALEEAKAGTETLTGRLKGMADAAQDANGATGKLTAVLKSLGPEGAAVAAVLTVVIGVVTALGAAFLSLAASAISISQEKDALAETFAALSTGAEAGADLVDSLSEVAAALPQAEGTVLAWGKSLMAAGLEGDKLNKAVKAVASSAALMGNDGGAAEGLIKRFQMMAESGGKVKLDRRIMSQLAEAGVSAATLAETLGVDAKKLSTMSIDADKMGDALQNALIKKGAKSLELMGLTWKSITGKLADGIGDLYEDMGKAVAPFMQEVKHLFDEFAAGGTAMSTVKGVFMTVFTEIFAVATKVVHGIHIGFLLVEIAAFKVAIAMLPIARAIKAIATNEDVIKGLKSTLLGLAVVAGVIVGGFLLVVAAGIATAVAIGTAITAIVTAFLWLQGASQRAGAAIGNALNNLGSIGYTAASNFISGLWNGIVNGYDIVANAASGLASKAAGAFKSALGIASPSKLMMGFGINMAEGVAEGVDAGSDDVAASTEAMGRAGASGAEKGLSKGGGPTTNTGGSRVYYITQTFTGVGADIAMQVRIAMQEFVEQEAAAGPDPVPA